jgi:MoxR-like ATPase
MESAKLAARVIDAVDGITVGRRKEIETLMLAVIAGGHALVEGPPGVGKTTMTRLFAQAIGGTFKRIQLTPDLLPADLVGTMVYNQRDQTFTVREGPIFANVLMLDEMNRIPPRTQSALIEAMQEKQVTIEGNTRQLPSPFIVLASELPYGAEGTYPLTEVQIDRFAVRIPIGYPTPEEEKMILSRVDEVEEAKLKPVAKTQDVVKMTEDARKVEVSDKVSDYIVSLLGAFRKEGSLKTAPGTRASIWLYRLSRARAYVDGREFVIPDDVKSVLPSALGHRLALGAEAEAEGTESAHIIERVLGATPVPKG